MTRRSVRLSLAAMLAAAGALALTAPAAAQAMPGTGGAVPAFCGGTGPIRAADLAAAVSLNGCELRGRLVVQSAGAAHIGVRVPPPGRAEGAEAATTSGDRVLVVSNTGGHVSATTSFRPVPAPAPADVTPATDPACNELAAAYLGFVWVETLNWFYNQSTVSRAGLDGPTTRDEIRQANRNITLGINNCGWSETGFGAFGAYQGTTDKFANINSAAECTSKFPDGQNTVSWGPFDSNEADTLALTCFEYDTGGNRFAIEADTYLGSNRRLVTSFSPFCSDSFDLQSVMTHEWGHSYGLDHVNAPHLVMYDFQSACALRRHLGEGDYAGMAHLYGLR